MQGGTENEKKSVNERIRAIASDRNGSQRENSGGKVTVVLTLR